MSEAALENLREQMRAAAAQIAAIKKEEKRQKKKEYDLLKILLKFVKTSQKTELVLLISRALEQNLPANFILAIILLGNEDIQKEVGEFLMLKSPENIPQEKALTFFNNNDETLPLKLKIEIDNWIKSILLQAEENPQKLLKTAYKVEFEELPRESEFDDKKYTEKKTIKKITIKLLAFVLRDYLEQNNTNEPFEKLMKFSEFILKGILAKTQENFENRRMLTE